MKYKKISLEVDAFLWNGKLDQEATDFMESGNVLFSFRFMGCLFYGENRYELEIKTLEGIMIANKGDYIIKGIKGELYPCKPDIFKLTYIKA